jgi:glycosyltransferase involved in cell wall biosynthesis
LVKRARRRTPAIGAEDVSVIVTTYDWPEALYLVLSALDRQSVRGFEVVVADDGSGAPTRKLLDGFRSHRFDLRHIWQTDEGFRAARCRNLAVAAARGTYLVFIDGDCLPREDFVERHMRLSRPGRMQRGNRILLGRAYTENLIGAGQIDELLNPVSWPRLRVEGSIGRILPLLRLPLGPVRRLRTKDWRGVKTSNLGIHRSDFYAVNGFDETFQGWGHEDADLAIRLLRNGVRRCEATFATTVFHLWHPEADRTRELENARRLAASRSGPIFCAEGLSSHLTKGSMR